MDISWMPKHMQKKFAGKGLGDIVKESIDTVSGGRIKQCGGCKKRQALLNKMLKFELMHQFINKFKCFVAIQFFNVFVFGKNLLN